MKFKSLCWMVILTWFTGTSYSFYKGDPKYPKGGVFGVGVGYSKYETKWKPFGTPSTPNTVDTPPIHGHTKTQLMVFYDARSLFHTGPMHIDIHGDLRFSVLGQTEQKYLIGLPSTVTKKGMNIGVSLQGRYVYPLMINPRLNLGPYLGLGFEFDYIPSAGEDVDPAFLEPLIKDLSYEAGWTESILSIPISIGLNLDLPGFSFNPEFRYGVPVKSSSNWSAGIYSPEIKSASYWAFLFSFGFRLGY